MPGRFTFPTDADFTYTFKLTQPDGTPYTGQSDIKCTVSDSVAGAVIGSMTAQSATETATLGTYTAVFAAADSLANITQREGAAGYICVLQGAKVLSHDACVFSASAPAG